MLLRDKWVKRQQIWPGHVNTVGQCVAELLIIQLIFTAWFLGRRGGYLTVGWSDLYEVNDCRHFLDFT